MTEISAIKRRILRRLASVFNLLGGTFDSLALWCLDLADAEEARTCGNETLGKKDGSK